MTLNSPTLGMAFTLRLGLGMINLSITFDCFYLHLLRR